MMMILAIDPGPVQSAYVCWCDGVVVYRDICGNEDMLNVIRSNAKLQTDPELAIEMIACYGMAVGRETFETCVWIGRFMQQWLSGGGSDLAIHRIPRLDIKINLCKSAKAKDANVRQALIDRLGPVGTKKSPGPLFGVTSHCWAALAVAVTCADQMQNPLAVPGAVIRVECV